MKNQLTTRQLEVGITSLVLAISLVLLVDTVRHQAVRAQAYKATSTQHSQTTVLSAGSGEDAATVVVDGQPVDLKTGSSLTTDQGGSTTTVTSSVDGSTMTTTKGSSSSNDTGNAHVNVSITSDNGNGSSSSSSQYTNVNNFSGSYGFQSSGSYHYNNGNVVVNQAH